VAGGNKVAAGKTRHSGLKAVSTWQPEDAYSTIKTGTRLRDPRIPRASILGDETPDGGAHVHVHQTWQSQQR